MTRQPTVDGPTSLGFMTDGGWSAGGAIPTGFETLGEAEAPGEWVTEDQSHRVPLKDADPNAFQWDLMRLYLSGETVLAIWGGIGCGKSVGLAMLAKTVAECRPGCQIAVVMKTYADLQRIAMFNFQTLLGPAWRYHATRRVFMHPNGSQILLAYYDLKSTQTEGENPLDGISAHLVILDEANKFTKPLVFKHCQDRARNWACDTDGVWHPPGVIINGRPSGIPWWPSAVRNMLAEARAAAEARGVPCRVRGRVMRVKSYVNAVALGTDYFDRQRAARTKAEYESIIEGGSFPQEGQFFADWSWSSWPDGNVLDDYEFDPDRRTWLSIDPGIVSPAAAVFQKVDRFHPVHGHIELHVLVDVIAPENVTTPALLELIRRRWWPRCYETCAPGGHIGWIDEVVLDPWGGRQRSRDTGKSTEDWIRKRPPGVAGAGDTEHGFGIHPEKHQASAGYRLSKSQRMICTEDGTRRLVVSPELHEREREQDADVRGWRHTQLSYKMDPRRGLPKKGGRGDPSGVADAVGDYLVCAAPDNITHESIDVEQLDLETGLYDVVGER